MSSITAIVGSLDKKEPLLHIWSNKKIVKIIVFNSVLFC